MELLGRSIERGGPVVAVLLGLAFLVAASTVYRLLLGLAALREARADLVRGRGPWRWPVSARLAAARRPEDRDRQVALEARRLRGGLGLLAALVAAAPLLGLLGTVEGMTQAFLALALAPGQPDLARLAGGISRALVTTLAGLLVSLPGILFHASLTALCANQERLLRALGGRMAEQDAEEARHG